MTYDLIGIVAILYKWEKSDRIFLTLSQSILSTQEW